MSQLFMTKDEKLKFAADLTSAVTKHILETIQEGKIPIEWDGIEMRQWIADTFKERCVFGVMDKRRMRNYRNDVLTHNL